MPSVYGYSQPTRAWLDLNHVRDFEPQPGVLATDGVVATFRWHGDGQPGRQHMDFDLILEVELASVNKSPHPTTDVAQRPWGSLDHRLRALLRAVTEYTEGLLYITREVRKREATTVVPPPPGSAP